MHPSFDALPVVGSGSVDASNDRTLLRRWVLAYRDGRLLQRAEASRAGQVLDHTLEEESGQERLSVILLGVLCYWGNK